MSVNETRRIEKLLFLVVLTGLAAFCVRNVVTARGPTPGIGSGMPVAKVLKGPLTISVSVSGVIKPKDQEVVRKETRNPQAILWIVPEGQPVKKGDLLVQLDTSELEDKMVDMEISVVRLEAAKIGAEERLEVTKNRVQSVIDKAELASLLAQKDFKNYSEGQYPRDLKSRDAISTLAKGTSKRSLGKLEGSKRLFEKGFISQTELAADEQDALKAKLDLELAENSKVLLTEYTHKRQLARLGSDVRQSRLALERAKRQASADIIRGEAHLNAMTLIYERTANYLAELEERHDGSTIYAPRDGVVMYASSGFGGSQKHGNGRFNSGPFREGTVVFLGQELIHLPQGDSLVCEARVHESDLTKVRVGQPVRITADAIKHTAYWGRIIRVSPLPDARSTFDNPDLKRYEVNIEFDGSTSGLRIGLNCLGEIIIAELKDALYIPVPAVSRHEGKPTAYVLKDGKLERREIEIGMGNNNVIHVTRGLEENEVVLLDPQPEIWAQTLGK